MTKPNTAAKLNIGSRRLLHPLWKKCMEKPLANLFHYVLQTAVTVDAR
jgi:hypothetical protein